MKVRRNAVLLGVRKRSLQLSAQGGASVVEAGVSIALVCLMTVAALALFGTSMRTMLRRDVVNSLGGTLEGVPAGIPKDEVGNSRQRGGGSGPSR